MLIQYRVLRKNTLGEEDHWFIDAEGDSYADCFLRAATEAYLRTYPGHELLTMEFWQRIN